LDWTQAKACSGSTLIVDPAVLRAGTEFIAQLKWLKSVRTVSGAMIREYRGVQETFVGQVRMKRVLFDVDVVVDLLLVWRKDYWRLMA
jgi:hypothetical protein